MISLDLILPVQNVGQTDILNLAEPGFPMENRSFSQSSSKGNVEENTEQLWGSISTRRCSPNITMRTM